MNGKKVRKKKKKNKQTNKKNKLKHNGYSFGICKFAWGETEKNCLNWLPSCKMVDINGRNQKENRKKAVITIWLPHMHMNRTYKLHVIVFKYMVIYKVLCFDVAQGRMNRAPNATRTHSYRFAGQAWSLLLYPRCPVYLLLRYSLGQLPGPMPCFQIYVLFTAIYMGHLINKVHFAKVGGSWKLCLHLHLFQGN